MGQALKNSVSGGTAPPKADWERLFHSPEAELIKAEIVRVGRKLWQRQYVDGNGGNISYRLTDGAIICTPTQMSKADLEADDLCMVDLAGNKLAGKRNCTSEILMHLEIYKAAPGARGIVHCHPPHATAYAITRRVPPPCIIPEYEMIVGRLALTQYETPGTQRFAETVAPYAKTHNTILLANHGIVAWADTVTHAEWCIEVADTYCWTLMLASQLGAPISQIGPEKAPDLFAIRQRLGLPDERAGSQECQQCDMPEQLGSIAVQPKSCGENPPALVPGELDIEKIVRTVTELVLLELGKARR